MDAGAYKSGVTQALRVYGIIKTAGPITATLVKDPSIWRQMLQRAEMLGGLGALAGGVQGAIDDAYAGHRREGIIKGILTGSLAGASMGAASAAGAVGVGKLLSKTREGRLLAKLRQAAVNAVNAGNPLRGYELRDMAAPLAAKLNLKAQLLGGLPAGLAAGAGMHFLLRDLPPITRNH